MIVENLVTFVGALLKHIIGVLLLCWRRMLRAGVIAFAIGAVVTVLVTVIGTGQAIPSVPSLIVALVFGLALAYAVALTVLVEELILGVIDLIRVIEGDISAGAHIAEVVAEREVGEVGQGLRRLIGLPVTKRTPARPGHTLPPLTRAQSQGQPVRYPARPAASTLIEAGAAGAAALAAARRAAPPPATPAEAAPVASEPTGEPVPADRLPRIAWTYEHEAIRPPAAPSAASQTAPTMEPEPAAAPIEVAETSAPSAAVEAEPIETPASAAVEAPGAAPPPAHGHMLDSLLGLATSAGLAGEVGAVVAGMLHGAPRPEAAAPGPEREVAYEDERLAAPAAIVTPEGPAEPAERVDDATEEPEGESAPAAAPMALAAASAAAPDEDAAAWAGAIPVPSSVPATVPLASVDTPAPAAEPAEPEPAATETDPTAGVTPAGRSDFSRRTLPLTGDGATLESPRAGEASVARPSAPESGLWERLSHALITRAGAPSGPFAPAPPQALPDDEPSTAGAAPQEPAPGGDE